MDVKKYGYTAIALLGVTLLFSISAFAQDAGEVLDYAVGMIGSFKGASTLVIVAGVVQIVIKLLSSSFFGKIFSSFNGFVKLMAISGFTIVSSIIALMMQGKSFVQAVMDGVVVSALMVYVNQIYQHIKEKPKA